ncbi:hypothetical protein VTN77DRAFT_6319 [Rasamsonia byssochlamydoides]|uniref:uncharacterized protein n=1 Tax=Rasamsonia byssochlamydoides TaxID=89139 RepID=UPI003742B4F3
MVYAFPLPTTSPLSFQTYLSSSTHPSLPQSASTARHALRLALKRHKRLPPRERETHLQTVLNALNDYLPYLFAISHGLSGKSVGSSGGGGVGEEVEITLRAEIEVEWRPVLTSSSSLSLLKGMRDGGRIKGRGLDFEIAFVLGTLGYVLSGLARVGVLRTLYAASTPTTEQRTAAVQAATKQLLQTSSVHSLLASSYSLAEGSSATAVPDFSSATQSALSSLALAEATLLAVLKDDAYTFACIQARNPHDKEWMVRAPEIPKVRALLFARLCVRAAEYAEQAAAGLGSVGAGGRNGSAAGKIDEDLVKYAQTLGKVARAKACRFFGVDAELAGKVGEGIAWLRAGKGALGFKRALAPEETTGKGGTISRLKREWAERREERKLEKGNVGGGGGHNGELDRGDGAGWEEECRVLDMLETKWVKMNNTVSTQVIPPSASLLSNLPSGRDIHSAPGPYTPPSLDEDQLVRMRAPPDEGEQQLPGLGENDDSDEEGSPGEPPGAFPSKPVTTDSTYF